MNKCNFEDKNLKWWQNKNVGEHDARSEMKDNCEKNAIRCGWSVTTGS